MASILNMDILIGASLNVSRRCPTSTGSGSPVISWILPEGFSQKRYSVRIRCLETGSIGYYQSGETISDSTSHQYPLGSPMNNQFWGLCSVEVAVSSVPTPGAPFEYTTGENVVKFVFDTVSESLYNSTIATLQWQNSYDPDTEQSVSYYVEASREPTFSDPLKMIYAGTVPQSTSGLRTSVQVPVDTNTDYFWRVKAYDGFDYSAFTKTNGFVNLLNFPPSINITNVMVTGNKYGDVYVHFTTYDEDMTDVYVTASYTGGNAGHQSTPMTIMNAVGKVPNGEHVILWRSGKDEKLVSSDDYTIYLSATDSMGASSSDTYGLFSMDNSYIGGETGGIGSVDTSFPVWGYITKIITHSGTHKVTFPAGIDNMLGSMHHPYVPGQMFRGDALLTSWRNYAICLLNADLRDDSPTDDQYPWFGHPRPAPMLPMTFTQGISAGANTFKGQDLDSGDPLFTDSLEYFSSTGWRNRVDEYEWSRNGMREGYVRFIENFMYDKNPCTQCDGKGWRVSDLVDTGEGRYARVPCPQCGGSRFYGAKTNGKWYCISDYKPISDWISPSRMGSSLFCGECGAVQSGALFFYGSKTTADKVMSTSQRFPTLFLQKDGETLDNSTYGIKGVYPFMSGWTSMAKKYTHTFDPGLDRYKPIESHIGPDIIPLSYDSGPFQGDISHGKYKYVPGYDISESPMFEGRLPPTHRWERGIWPMTANFSRKKMVEQLKIIYLQSGWDIYNTIHWQATMSNLTRIHLQTAKFFPDGSRTEYVDVISELSSFEPSAGVYLVEPNTWHTYWDTVRRQIIDEGYDYRLRIRQFDLSTKTFSQWVYSSKFILNHDGSNPANVVNTEYEIWGNRVVIYFRLDDSQNDSYDITRVWYAIEGEDFKEILMSDIYGEIVELSSSEGKNIHYIKWGTGPYSLLPGDRYRVKIEVIPTKMIGEMSDPTLSFSHELNPVHTRAEKEIIRLCGHMQKYVYNQSSGQFELLPSGVLMPGDIQRTEDNIASIESYPPPSGKMAFFNPSGVLIDPSGYEAWLQAPLLPGITRRSALYELGRELDNMMYTELPYWQDESAEAERRTRKRLIDQGYYCNGFIDNSPGNGIFRFRVESMGFGDEVLNPDGSYKIVYDPRYEVYERVQIDFAESFDSQGGLPLRDFMFTSEGERIKGSDWNRDEYVVPGGTVDNNAEQFTRTWNGFGEGDGQPWDTGNRADGQITEDGMVFPQKSLRRRYASFNIPKDELPGERVDRFISNSRPSVTDILPSGIESFETDYVWRSAYYNIVSGTAREVPRHEISQIVLVPGSKITVSYMMKGDIELQSATMSSLYYSISSSAISASSAVTVAFPTDRPEGYEAMTPDNPYLWTPAGKLRSRPCVAYYDFSYWMWYSKDTSSGEPGIVHARGKNFDSFGEYSISIPRKDGKSMYEEIDGATSAFAPCVVREPSLWRMWFTAGTESTTLIYTCTSEDGDLWSDPVMAEGIPDGSYSPFVILDGGTYRMWFCRVHSGLSKIFYATSDDGVSFSAVADPVLSSSGNLNTPSVVKFEQTYYICYTRYLSDNGKICARSSSDGLSWSSESVLVDVDGSINPCLVPVMEDGIVSIRMFYNLVDGEDISVRCSRLSDRTWTQLSMGLVSGDVSELPCSEEGYSNSLDIMLGSAPSELRNLSSPSNLRIRLVFSNDTDTRDFIVQSDWMLCGSNETYDSDLVPAVFKYNENVKGLYFGDSVVSSSRFATGVSPRVVVSCEECSWHKYRGETPPPEEAWVPNPPMFAPDGAISESMNLWRQVYPEWFGGKVSEPLFDGIADKIGRPSNIPDYISSHHFISVMRNVEKFVQPAYVANINAHTTTPVPWVPRKVV